MISSRVLPALHWIGSVIRLCFHLHALSRKAVGGNQHRSRLGEWGLVGMNRHSNRHTPRRKCKMRSKFWWLTDFAIRMTYRISLRSSSVWEPRHPLLKVFWRCSLARAPVDRSPRLLQSKRFMVHILSTSLSVSQNVVVTVGNSKVAIKIIVPRDAKVKPEVFTPRLSFRIATNRG